MKTLAPIALAVSLLAPVAATAAGYDDVPVARVSHADLDLTQQKGAETMLNRLDRASMSVCGASKFSFREVRDAVRASDCYHQSMDRAVASLAEPSVTGIYRAQIQRLAAN